MLIDKNNISASLHPLPFNQVIGGDVRTGLQSCAHIHYCHAVTVSECHTLIALFVASDDQNIQHNSVTWYGDGGPSTNPSDGFLIQMKSFLVQDLSIIIVELKDLD